MKNLNHYQIKKKWSLPFKVLLDFAALEVCIHAVEVFGLELNLEWIQSVFPLTAICCIFGCSNDQNWFPSELSGKKKRNTGYEYLVQEECGTIEDCFDNFQPCPRYGVVVKVTYTTGKSSYGSGYGLTERQTGEGFKSAAPPDCRVTS